MMSIYQHRPWRELFVRDVNVPTLVYRPAPWLDLEGNFVQDVSGMPLTTWPVKEDMIIGSTLMRTEQQLLNYFFTFPDAYGAFAALVKETPRPFEGFFSQDNPYLEDKPFDPTTIPNLGDGARPLLADYHRYGFRPAEFSSPYLDWARNTKADTIPSRIADARVQGQEWNRRVMRAFRYNHLVENGALTLRGDERLQAGDYLRLVDRGRDLVGGVGLKTEGPRYYIESVVHQFAQGTQPHDGHFITSCEVSFGRGHLTRNFQLRG